MRLLIIRHADPDYENHTITTAGHREAEALSRRMQDYGLTRIVASPLGRAQHTAQYTAERTGLPIETEQWLEELHELRMQDGPAAGYMAWDLHGHLLRERPEAAVDGSLWDCPGLSQPRFRDEVRRVAQDSDRFIERLGYRREGGRYRVLNSSNEQVAVFCHNGLALTWLSHLLELPILLVWSGFWLSPSSVTTVLFDERNEHWATPRCLAVGDTSHLYAAGLPVQPAGIKGNFH